ncbi:MAG: transposase [Saprospiraceae bacterium]
MPSHFYHRKLPHFQPAEATFFVTFRLAGSIPVEVIRRLRENYELIQKGILEQKDLTEKERRELVYAEQKRLFAATDDFLDMNPNEPYWLREREVAEIVEEAMHYRDEKQYDLHAFTIMPNHVHMMMTLLPDAPVLFKVMQHLKKNSAIKANRFLNRTGLEFWEEESYDHIVRDESEFYRILNYILRNPVKAGFVSEWRDWPFSFAKPELL